MKKSDIKLENGKVVIESPDMIKQIEDQGMNFTDDGSLNLEDGANLTISITVK